MPEATKPVDLLNDEAEPMKLPQTLNVLTILTFIGCATALFGSIRNFFTIQSTYEKLLQHQGDLNQTTGLVKAFTDSALEMTRKSVEHRTPILIISLVGMALCLLGALWMRKLQKTGFYVYLIGELLPVVIGVFLLGMGSLGGVLIVPALLVPAVFIVLYATQVKFMR